MKPSDRNSDASATARWTEIIAHNPDAFLRAYARGEIDTDVLEAPSPGAGGPPGDVTTEAVVSFYSAFNGGVLTTYGDALDNAITFSRDAAGRVLVNGGAVQVIGGTPTVANTSVIQAFGQGGNDTITVNEANGALPRVNLYGGAGNDALTGGSGADMLFGQSGNDTLVGRGGVDLLFGGSENDTLIGGDGNDQVFGESGNDRMVWNPGDDSDLMEGGDGIDTVEVNGGNGNEVFTLTANGTRVRFDRLDPAPFNLDIGTTEKIVVNMNGGDDTFSATGNLAALIGVTVDGGAGNDTISGSNGADLLIGGDGNDFLDGNQGNDVAFLGAGDDTFQWDPGDGSDTVEGQAGNDAMVFNGSNANEAFDVSANGSRVRFTRNVGSIVMDVDDVERIDVAARGGNDTVVVNDLGATDVVEIGIDLAATPGGVGDALVDTVIVNATGGANTIDVVGSGDAVSVLGLSALVSIDGSEAADRLVVNALGGDDTINASTLAAGVTSLTIDGGAGNDTIIGSQGSDVLIAGDGNDFVDGQQGSDVAFLGAGDDVFQWDPGDGSDTVEGQDGLDTLLFNGSNANESVDIAANGARVRVFRDIASVTMDLDDVERIRFVARGGTDSVVVGDLSGTDVARVDVDLAGSAGGSDGQADTVTVNATQGADVFGVAGTAGSVTVSGLSASVVLASAGSEDRLTLNGLGGDDVIDASGLEAGVVQLTINGGLGADVLIGSMGDDLVSGGDGNDTAFMGAGDDTFVWNPGDDSDVVEGQAGFDTLRFNGSNVAENIDISANGGRVRFVRDVAGVTMDLNDVEQIDFAALGGADNITVRDLTGTDVVRVDVSLAGAGGIGDGQADTVAVHGTAGDDTIAVAGDASGVSVMGLAAQVNVTGGETANDRVVVVAGAGDDVIEASGLSATGLKLTADGGAGNDVLIGGDGDDILLGGDGDDVLIGGNGIDTLDGGAGNDVLIAGPGDIVIQNFQAGAGSGDRIDLRGLSGLTYDWLIAHAKVVGGDAVIDLGNGDQITLVGVNVGTLHADDFMLG